MTETAPTRPLLALLLSDGRPGHYHRAEGILAAIARLRPVETMRLAAHRRRWIPGRLLASLTNADVIAPARLLKLGYGIDATSFSRAELVVSAGGNTIAANIAAAKLLRVPNIFYGGLRQFRPEHFALILTSYGGDAARARHRMTPLMPVPLDPDRFPRVAEIAIGPTRPPRMAGLLVGGNSGTFRYQPHEWRQLLEFIAQSYMQHGTRWIVSNSRRTPPEFSDEIARRSHDAAGPIGCFIDVRAQGPGSLQQLFTQAEVVVCTADSSSMITEAVWLRRPAIAVAPLRSGFAQREGWYRDHLAAHNWVRSIQIAELSPPRFLAALAQIRPLVDNALDLLAGGIKDCLPALFASPRER
jgi:uncharacterized protein